MPNFFTFMYKYRASFKAIAYRLCISAVCFFTVGFPMKILIESLGMINLMPLWSGLYGCLIFIVGVCLDGRDLPKRLVFVTVFSITMIVGYIFILILPELLSSIKQLAVIIPSLGLFSYYGRSYVPIDLNTSIHSMDTNEVNKANPAGKGASNSGQNSPPNSELNEYEKVADKLRQLTSHISSNITSTSDSDKKTFFSTAANRKKQLDIHSLFTRSEERMENARLHEDNTKMNNSINYARKIMKQAIQDKDEDKEVIFTRELRILSEIKSNKYKK